MNKKQIAGIAGIILLSWNILFSQQSKIDSLLSLLKIQKEDTNTVIRLNLLSREYINVGSHDTAHINANLGLRIAEKLNFKSGIANAYSNIGHIYYLQANYPKTLEYWLKALKIDEELHDKIGIAKRIGNIGNVYRQQGDFLKALEYFSKALEMNESLGNKFMIAINFGNIATIHYSTHDYQKALDYSLRGLKIFEELENKSSIANMLFNIGSIYVEQGKIEKSKFKRDSLYSHGLDYYFKSLKMSEETGQKNLTAKIIGDIGSLYYTIKKYKEAGEYLKKSLALNEQIGALDVIQKQYENYSNIDSALGNYKDAFIHFKKAMALKDTLFSQESSQKIAIMQFNYEQEKKDKIRELEEKVKEQEHNAEVKQQNVITWSVVAGLLLAVVFSSFLFNRFKVTQRQKKIIEKQKLLTDEKNKIIEEKNKDITDSINYAQRIQKALLASDGILNKNLGEHFVLFKPKDIVSGDFYWATEKEGRFYLAVCDSTGHGVPGAFMSLLNISFLNEAINEEGILYPNKIFNHVRQRLIQNISQDGGKDGMDGILLCFNKTKNEIYYAGANNAPYIMNGALEELPTDNMPVGLGEKQDSFSHNVVSFNAGNILYLYTDGYPDQFGGPKGKKFKYKPLNELLASIRSKPLAEQKTILEKTFEDWKGALEQVDDVLIIGIKI